MVAASDVDRAGPHACGTLGTLRHWPASSRSFPFCTIDEDPPQSRASLLGSQKELGFLLGWGQGNMEGDHQNGPQPRPSPAQLPGLV